MFQSLEIENFQNHTNTYIEFSPGVTLIAGESDAGKSAIIRALLYICRNQLSRKLAHNWNAAKTPLHLTLVTDKHTITRVTNKSTINYYTLDENPIQLTGFGKNKIPDDIQKALRVNDINFQQQRDSFFLLNKTAGEVGKYLNNVVNLNVIDTSLTHAKLRTRQITTEKEYIETTVRELQTELKSYDWIDSAAPQLKRLEEWENDLQDYRNSIEQMQNIITQHAVLYNAKTYLQKQVAFKQRLTQLIQKEKQLTIQKQELPQIQNIITNYTALLIEKKHLQKQVIFKQKIVQLMQKEKQLAIHKQEIPQLQNLITNTTTVQQIKKNAVSIVRHQPQLCVIGKRLAAVTQLQNEHAQLATLINQLNDAKITQFRTRGILDKLQTEFEQRMPARCPLCDTQLEN